MRTIKNFLKFKKEEYDDMGNVPSIFCYRIEKDAKLTEDERGNATELYLARKLKDKTGNVFMVEKDKFEKEHNFSISGVADFLGIDPQHVTPIPLEEYKKYEDV